MTDPKAATDEQIEAWVNRYISQMSIPDSYRSFIDALIARIDQERDRTKYADEGWQEAQLEVERLTLQLDQEREAREAAEMKAIIESRNHVAAVAKLTDLEKRCAELEGIVRRLVRHDPWRITKMWSDGSMSVKCSFCGVGGFIPYAGEPDKKHGEDCPYEIAKELVDQ